MAHGTGITSLATADGVSYLSILNIAVTKSRQPIIHSHDWRIQGSPFFPDKCTGLKRVSKMLIQCLYFGTKGCRFGPSLDLVWDFAANQSCWCENIPNLADEAVHFGCSLNQIVDDRGVRRTWRTYLQSRPPLVLALEESKCPNAGNMLLQYMSLILDGFTRPRPLVVTVSLDLTHLS